MRSNAPKNIIFHRGIKKVTGKNVSSISRFLIILVHFFSDLVQSHRNVEKKTGAGAQERSFSVTVVPISNAQSITMSYRGHSVTTISTIIQPVGSTRVLDS